MNSNRNKIQLHGFNNLTKTLSFNIYDIAYAENPSQRQAYIEYIDEAYNAERLTHILTEVASIIEANVLNISTQDYEPQGASVVVLISEKDFAPTKEAISEAPGPLPQEIAGHLDKSHLTVHTYPETHPDHGICTFRVDIDVATCGVISPLKALNYLIHSFDSDIVTMDYRIRGFTRDVNGNKHFKDHEINSIQNYMLKETLERYQTIDVNVYQENIFHTKMILKEFDLDNYLFEEKSSGLSIERQQAIREQLNTEMLEIFYGKNF